MLSILKNLFASGDNNALAEAIKEGAFLVDVRTASEFSAGSVPGAVNIPVDKIAGQLSAFRNRKNIVVFCQSGGRSSQAKRILEQNGYQQVINGGGWQNVYRVVTA